MPVAVELAIALGGRMASRIGSTYKDRAYSEQRQGGNTLNRLLSSKPAPTEPMLSTFLSVIVAVEEVHRTNKGQRCNLDPRNIFLRDDGTVELSTLARPDSGMTVVLSSSKYSAPEMVEDTTGQVESGLLDSYILGFVFYEMFLGVDLFERQFLDVVVQGKFGWLAWHADKTKHAKPLSKLINGFPSVLSNVIEGMMAKEPSKRITDFHWVANTIGGASQATMMISDLSMLQGSDDPYMSQRTSVAQKADNYWGGLVSSMRSILRVLLRVNHRHSGIQQVLRQGGAERANSARAQQSPNSRKGSGLEQ